ncbi:hypothetical protein JMY23_002354 [Listeria monocytogenes]|nr:hypothetical protein [Listeria monocytogenes]
MELLRIPEKASSKVKLFWEIYLFDLLAAIAYGVVVNMFSSMVYPLLLVPYWLVLSVGFIFIMVPSRSNKELKMYQAFFLALTKERAKVVAFDYEWEETSIEIGMEGVYMHGNF